MKRWLILLAAAALLFVLALTSRWWLSPLLEFLGANSEVIQGAASAIQIALWAGALLALIFGWRGRARQSPLSTPVATASVQAQDGAVAAQDHSAAARDQSIVVGRDVYGDLILVADPDQLWQRIRRRPPAEELRRATAAYLRHLVDKYQYLDFKGMGVSDRVALRLPLAEIYVPLKARIELPERETWDRKPLRVAGRALTPEEVEAVGARLSEPLPVLDLLQRHDGLIILGDPGAGKTTFLKYLTLMLAQGRGESLGLAASLPVLVPLSAYANALTEREMPLDRFIADYYNSRGIDLPLDAMLAEALAQGGALILLDGLDEVRDQAQRATVVSRVVDFFTIQRQRGNKFLLTSRIVGYREVRPTVAGLGECTLIDFEEAEIEQFVERWTGAIERAARGDTPVAGQEARREQTELLDAIHRNPGVRQLAANPLLLTILALMKRQGVTLPERRVELYQKYVETLLKHWNLARGLGRPPSRDLDVVETTRILAPLAYWMHRASPGVGLVKQEAMRQELEAICAQRALPEPEQAARRFLEDVRDYAGLLLERGPREYGFIHLTFQEYLAAAAIAQQGQQDAGPMIDALAAHMGEETWREVSLLTVGYVGIIQQRDEVASMLAAGLIEAAPGEPGAAVVLAGEAVLDAWPGGVTYACREGVIQALNRTMTDAAIKPAIRLQAGLALARFDIDPPGLDDFVPPLGQPRGELDEPPWGFHIARYPVTNKQYRRFVEAGGYDQNRPWWNEKAIKDIENYWSGWPEGPRFWGDDRFGQSTQPVVGVSWYEANAYCQWLTGELRQQGRIGSDREVRLPTRAQWQRAAGGKAYPWGDAFDPARANTEESGLNQTTPVHMYPDGRTTEGVWDLSGNVWEWSADVDAGGWPWFKGGSWYENRDRATSASAALRGYPRLRFDLIGFRVVVVPSSRV